MSDFQSLMDRTRFDLVRRLMNRHVPPYAGVLFVGSRSVLREIADLLTGPVNPVEPQRLLHWFKKGRITVGTTGAPLERLLLEARWPDICPIDREAFCDELYLPPYYCRASDPCHSSSFAAHLER